MMRKGLLVIVAGLIAAMGMGVAAPSPALAYPTSDWSVGTCCGYTSGYFTWYNRSVGLNGKVTEFELCHCGEYADAIFAFYTGANQSGTYVGQISFRAYPILTNYFNTTKDGSAYSGGIRSVAVTVCEHSASYSDGIKCVSWIYNRP
jgi:hypothetical protein